MNDPVEFTTEDGMRVGMILDGDGRIMVRLRVDDGREVTFRLTPDEGQTFINGLVITNNPVVGAWGWHHNRAVHIPSYNQGRADALVGS